MIIGLGCLRTPVALVGEILYDCIGKKFEVLRHLPECAYHRAKNQIHLAGPSEAVLQVLGSLVVAFVDTRALVGVLHLPVQSLRCCWRLPEKGS